MRQFYDMFDVTFEKDGTLTIKKRLRPPISHDHKYQAIRMIPNTTIGQANPAKDQYHIL